MKLRDILKTEKDWTKGYYARNSEGLKVLPDSGEAVCYCISGAICASGTGYASTEMVTNAIKALFPERVHPEGHAVPEFNDHPETTFDDVCKVIELAGV